jgi:hypothetical protein
MEIPNGKRTMNRHKETRKMDEKQISQFSNNIQDFNIAAFCDNINARLYSI